MWTWFMTYKYDNLEKGVYQGSNNRWSSLWRSFLKILHRNLLDWLFLFYFFYYDCCLLSQDFALVSRRRRHSTSLLNSRFVPVMTLIFLLDKCSCSPVTLILPWHDSFGPVLTMRLGVISRFSCSGRVSIIICVSIIISAYTPFDTSSLFLLVLVHWTSFDSFFPFFLQNNRNPMFFP